MIVPYSNVRDARFELKEKETVAGAVVHDVQMLGFLRLATVQIKRRTGISFNPVIASETWDNWEIDSANGILYLPGPMFDVTEVKDGNGTILAADKYEVASSGIITSIQFASNTCLSWYRSCCGGNKRSLAAVSGIWGYHYDTYENAWLNSLDTVQDAPLSSSANTLKVDDADGADLYARTPRFSPGQLLRVEDEFLLVTSVDTTTDDLTVMRGVNGSTAAEHAAGTQIDIWEPVEDIQQATRRWACYPYKRRGNYQNTETDTVNGISLTFPSNAPGEVLSILQIYANGVP